MAVGRKIMIKVFSEVRPPSEHRKAEINKDARWLTWSPGVQTCLHSLRTISVPDPRFIHLSGGKDYDYTYTIELESLPSVGIRKELTDMAEAMLHLSLKQELWLLTNLIEPLGSVRLLHILFASLRGVLAGLSKNPMSALYAPLGNTGSDADDFPLHADLYLPEVLFNVFANVPSGRSGASIFLKASAFAECLRHADVPEEIQWKLLAYLREPIQSDSYHDFYHLLHDADQPWYPSLSRIFRRRQYRIKLTSGEGYMVHDRSWLHGRTSPKGGVKRNRLCRLIFQPENNPLCLVPNPSAVIRQDSKRL